MVVIIYLRKNCSDYPGSWGCLIDNAAFAINNAVSAITGVSLFEALMGYFPRFLEYVLAEQRGYFKI